MVVVSMRRCYKGTKTIPDHALRDNYRTRGFDVVTGSNESIDHADELMTALSFIGNRRRASASAVTMSDQVDAAAARLVRTHSSLMNSLDKMLDFIVSMLRLRVNAHQSINTLAKRQERTRALSSRVVFPFRHAFVNVTRTRPHDVEHVLKAETFSTMRQHLSADGIRRNKINLPLWRKRSGTWKGERGRHIVKGSPTSPTEIISIRGSLFTKTRASLWSHLAGTLPRTWILSGKIPTQLPVVHNLRASSINCSEILKFLNHKDYITSSKDVETLDFCAEWI
ncbi:hypothetical protein ALC56_12913 [Trachymyrmex septentrionalis]|uniref:Uncharacterized protein n=1 Tax=Trachymyrmex septentrionalis TaxID=34720 RepID=A0A151JTE0_9HYME|nr:hypothetical protein ALC56_12913 [Trachymyrmex septentrionalis]